MKCGVNKWTLRSFAVRALLFANVAALTLNRALTPVAASDYRVPLPTVADGQSNMAAMIDSPSDLVQPRPETPVYTMRPTEGFEEYRKGNATATQYPDAERAKLSDTGK